MLCNGVVAMANALVGGKHFASLFLQD